MELYRSLKKKQLIRRIIEAIIALISIVSIIVFRILRENSKIVETIGAPPFAYESVSYTHNYTWATLISVLFFAIAVSFLLADILFSRVYYRKVDEDDMIIYRGLGLFKLFINGIEKDSTFGKSYLEATLKNGVKITASYQFFCSFHITFSDNRPSIDL